MFPLVLYTEDLITRQNKAFTIEGNSASFTDVNPVSVQFLVCFCRFKKCLRFFSFFFFLPLQKPILLIGRKKRVLFKLVQVFSVTDQFQNIICSRLNTTREKKKQERKPNFLFPERKLVLTICQNKSVGMTVDQWKGFYKIRKPTERDRGACTFRFPVLR